MSTKDQVKQAFCRVSEKLAFQGPLKPRPDQELTSVVTAMGRADRFTVSVLMTSSAHPNLIVRSHGATHYKDGRLQCDEFTIERLDQSDRCWRFRFSCGIDGDDLEWELLPRPVDFSILSEVRPGARLRLRFHEKPTGELLALESLSRAGYLTVSVDDLRALWSVRDTGNWERLPDRTITVATTEHFDPSHFRGRLGPTLEGLEIVPA